MAKKPDIKALASKALEEAQETEVEETLDEEQLAESTIEEVEEQEVEQPVEKEAASEEFNLAKYLKSKHKVNFQEDASEKEIAPRIGKVFEENRALQAQLAESEKLREQQLGEFLQSLPEFEEFRKSKKQQAAASQESQPAQSKWKPLDYDPDWEVGAEYDPETRRYIPKPKMGTFGVTAAEHLNEYTRQQKDRAHKLTSDPWSLVREAGADEALAKLKAEQAEEMKKLRDEIQRWFVAERTTEQVVTEVEDWTKEHEKDLFVIGKNGKPVLDENGVGQLSERGEVYRAAYIEAHEDGLSHSKAHKYAAREFGRSKPQEKAEEKTPAQKNAEAKKKFIDKGFKAGSRTTQRDGTLKAAKDNGSPQNKFVDFREMALSDPDNAELLGAHFKG